MSSAHNRYIETFARFAEKRPASEPAWVQQVRRAAISRFAELGFPTTHHEEWKYTNIAPLVKTHFELASTGLHYVTDEAERFLRFGQEGGARLVFVNGQYSEALSSLPPLPPGVQVANLASVLMTNPDQLEPSLARYAPYQDHTFIALNTAFLADGAFVSLPRGTVLERPIHLVFISTIATIPLQFHPRNLYVMGENSQATIVEQYIGLRDGSSLTNAVTELVLGENAVLDYYALQHQSKASFHMGSLQVQQARSSTFSSCALACGGALARSEVNVALDGEDSTCTLSGLYVAADRQHLDNRTQIDHVAPSCTSRELYKGILGGQAHGVFNGKIVVHPNAQKTDATQINQNLLLSESALVNSKPQLEIRNNDVRCSHGSTTGSLDQEALFYLRTRGIDLHSARRLLTSAFASDIVNRVKSESLRAYFESIIAQQLHTLEK